MKKIEIRSRFSGELIFSHECKNNTIAATVEAAIEEKVDLCGADLKNANLRSTDIRSAKLYTADLRGVDFYGADLFNADFYGADIQNANFKGANLHGADFRFANLYEVNFDSANLYGVDFRGINFYGADLYKAAIYAANFNSANFGGANLGKFGRLTGARPFFQFGPIGTRQDNLLAFKTDKGIFIFTGWFFGTYEEFKNNIESKYYQTVYGKEYKAALAMIDAHYTLWSTSDIS